MKDSSSFPLAGSSVFRLGSNWEKLGNSHSETGSTAMFADKMTRHHGKESTSDFRGPEGGSLDFEELLQSTQDSLGGVALLTLWESVLMVHL